METTSPGASSRSDGPGYSVGLTGGIGSGKSAVAELFVALGAAVIDSDVIARDLTAPGGEAIVEIADAFGAEFIDPRGGLDRARMRDEVFRDPSSKARLEAILHPRIRSRTAAAAAATDGHSPYLMFVVPLLIESRTWRHQVDRLLVIDCAISSQENRVRARSGLEVALVRAIISQQASRQERLDAADDVLVNEGSLAQLVPRVGRLHRLYRDLAGERSGTL